MFHIIKSSRAYEESAYSGPTCERAGVTPGKSYSSREEAQNDAEKLRACNPVGFTVVESYLKL